MISICIFSWPNFLSKTLLPEVASTTLAQRHKHKIPAVVPLYLFTVSNSGLFVRRDFISPGYVQGKRRPYAVPARTVTDKH